MRSVMALAAACAVLVLLVSLAVPAQPPAKEAVDRGRYIAVIGGCNDCHTPGYAEKDGNIPEAQWLVGSPLGFRGPWGTTYPANLRLLVKDMDAEGWMQFTANLHTQPPMPWYDVRAMNAEDRGALFDFIRSLGPAGGEAPASVPPDQTPKGPVVQWPMP
jgi:mono/diheme cytochrome c family protein